MDLLKILGFRKEKPILTDFNPVIGLHPATLIDLEELNISKRDVKLVFYDINHNEIEYTCKVTRGRWLDLDGYTLVAKPSDDGCIQDFSSFYPLELMNMKEKEAMKKKWSDFERRLNIRGTQLYRDKQGRYISWGDGMICCSSGRERTPDKMFTQPMLPYNFRDIAINEIRANNPLKEK